MSNEPKPWVTPALTAAAQKKKVLAVEGKTDEAVYREWMGKQLGSTWANQVHLVNAQSRSPLLAGLRWLQENNDPFSDVIFGLADRDEWEPADVVALRQELPTLLVNQDRHSLESYFCDPGEIEVILNLRDAASGTITFGPHVMGIRELLESVRSDWVSHWALCCTIQRANERIRRDAQYPAFFRNTCPLPVDEDIKTKLNEWAAFLNPDSIFGSFDSLRSSSLTRPVSEQFRSCVEPKLFFGKIVIAAANGLNSIQQKSGDDWLIELARWSPAMPPDLETTLAPVLA